MRPLPISIAQGQPKQQGSAHCKDLTCTPEPRACLTQQTSGTCRNVANCKEGQGGGWQAWRRMLRDGLLGWMRALQQPCSAPGAVPALLPRAGVPAPGAVPIACHQTRCQHARLSAEAEGTSCRKNILPGPAWSYLVLFSCTLVLFGPIRSFLVLLGPVRSYLVRLGPV